MASTIIKKQGETTYFSGHYKLRREVEEAEANEVIVDSIRRQLKAAWPHRHHSELQFRMVRAMIHRLKAERP